MNYFFYEIKHKLTLTKSNFYTIMSISKLGEIGLYWVDITT